MDTRYQVFISSTFTDLKYERQAVLKAVLELDQMPAGMELFPASDDTAWKLIKDVIDASDYYVVIIGGRYGSQDETGIGFTEKEYDYAVQTKKPVIPLLHQNPDNLPREKTETEEAIWEKLKEFRAKVEKGHTCVYWNSPDDLKAKVIVGLTATMKRHPGSGWVRADEVPTEATISEMLALRKRIAELEAERAADRVRPPEGTEYLAQGEDTLELEFTFDAYLTEKRSTVASFSGSIHLTWNEIFAAVAPSMIHETSDYSLASAFLRVVEAKALEVASEDVD